MRTGLPSEETVTFAMRRGTSLQIVRVWSLQGPARVEEEVMEVGKEGRTSSGSSTAPSAETTILGVKPGSVQS